MRALAGRAPLLGVLIALVAGTAPALAFGPVGTDPAANYRHGALPGACTAQPTGAVCVDAAVRYLDAARATLGQPPYALPADFAALSADRQVFILANLDRTLDGLPAVGGLTAQLDRDAAAGAVGHFDPLPSDTSLAVTSNWAAGDRNVVMAYLFWMFDDGPGSGNVDCTAAKTSGCWGHRHDVLWSFDGAPTGMGVAVAPGRAGYAMLIVGGHAYAPAYSYTWDQAKADGAGTHVFDPGPGPTPAPGSATAPRTPRAVLSVRVLGGRTGTIRFTITAPAGSRLTCSLTRLGVRARFVACARKMVFHRAVAGRYVLRVRAGARQVSRTIRVVRH